jgi:HK97 family phage prohead protease
MGAVAISPSMNGIHFGAGSDLVILKGKKNEPLVIAGYASVDVVDKQNDLITLEALRDASSKFMKSDYKNVMITHSNVQVGEVVNNWQDKKGNVLKTGVDDTGFFVVIKMRNDIEKAKEVARDIRRGKLRSFSIGGQALHKANRYDPEIGTYKEIDKLELHEITICEEGINPEAKFDIVKQKIKNGDKMTNEIEKALNEFNDIVSELRNQVSVISKEEDYEEPVEEEPMTEDSDMMEAKADPDEEPGFEDEDSMHYGKDHEAKAESIVYGHNATGNSIEGTVATHADSEFNEYIKRKSESVDTLNLSHENLAKAYEQFKAEQEEARAYAVIKNEFESRYQAELKAESDAVAKSKYDAAHEVESLKTQFAELRKSLESNNNVIAKQVEQVQTGNALPDDVLLKMQNLHELSWEEVNELAREVQGL